MTRTVTLIGDVIEGVREVETRELEEFEFDEKRDGVTYRDECWTVSGSWLDADKTDIMFSWAAFDVPASELPEDARQQLEGTGLLVQSTEDDEVMFAAEYDHLSGIPEYITDRIVNAGYRLFTSTEPRRCPQCGHNEFLRRFADPAEPVEHVVLTRWECMECNAPIDAEIPDAPAIPRGDEPTEDVYGETKDSHRHLGYCPECDAERMIFETVSNERDVCQTCGSRVPDGGEVEDEEVSDE